nr:Fur family transcriptional regulator [uncultured Sulfurimonas sp.]
MQIENIIKDKNLKLTLARRELLEILIEENKPISFENIKNKISMDKATFYRNISIFEDNNIVKSFESNDKKRYYELQNTPHPHFICNVCNAIKCLKSEDIKLEGYTVVDIIYKGVCKNCMQSDVITK